MLDPMRGKGGRRRCRGGGGGRGGTNGEEMGRPGRARGGFSYKDGRVGGGRQPGKKKKLGEKLTFSLPPPPSRVFLWPGRMKNEKVWADSKEVLPRKEKALLFEGGRDKKKSL